MIEDKEELRKVLKQRERLAIWAVCFEGTIIEALRQCMDRYPSFRVSKFERALDAMPSKEKVKP